MMELIYLLVLFQTTHSVKHSLTYFLTSSSGLQNFPRFVAVSKVDGVPVGYCDSSKKTAEPRQDWVQKLKEEEPEHVQWHIQNCLDAIHDFQRDLDQFRQHFNHTEGVHVLQELSVCEWDSDTDEIIGYQQLGYDGEDILSVDTKTVKWKFTEKAAFFKQKRDKDKARLIFNTNFLTHYCPQWLKQYIVYGRRYLLRKDRPSVSLLQKTPSSAVSCHATGFYPDRALMFWSKDGEEIHEGVEHGEILPNHDGTFQMTVDLNVSSAEDWRRYHCVFQFVGAEDRIITELDQAAIRTNRVSSSVSHALIAIGVVLIFLVFPVFLAVITVCVLRRRRRRNG
ncbi:major histocompatibility complex class I-related gene protein-like [Parambassis ranga]|uniref:Major histocompatibility complex class I-related gene protein-like n=1 Tax=Parambassis ranga TaxID=210632 RepID=A0A6P7K1Y1_9TELE|nr:major histocompatibility complex class I-related gene protein-like [Parambassis ranga]